MSTSLGPRFAVSVTGFVSFIGLYAPQAMLTKLTAALHTSQETIGLTITAATLAVALSGPFIGMLADMTGRKRVIVPAALILAIPTALLAIAPSFPAFLCLRFLQGLCLPAIFGVVVAYIAEEWPPAEAPTLMSWYLVGAILGGFCGRYVAAFMTATFGWQSSFLALGAITACGGLLMWATLPPAKNFRRSGRVLETLVLMRGHMTNGRLLGTCAVGFMVLFSLVGCFTYVDFYLEGPPFALSGTTLGNIFAVYLIGAVITPITTRIIRTCGRRGGLALALGCSAGGLFLTLTSHLPLVIAGLALCSAAVFVSQGISMGSVGLIARSARSAAVGLYVTCYYIGGSVGAIVPGIAWRHGGWSGCVALIVVFQILAVIAGLISWRPPLGAPNPVT